MSRLNYRDRMKPRPSYRAQFRGLKVSSFGIERIIRDAFLIELRPCSPRSQLYRAYYATTHAKLSLNAAVLRLAKADVESLFSEQVSPWEELPTC